MSLNSTNTDEDRRTASIAVKDIVLSNPEGLREVMQEVLEAEMDEALGANWTPLPK